MWRERNVEKTRSIKCGERERERNVERSILLPITNFEYIFIRMCILFIISIFYIQTSIEVRNFRLFLYCSLFSVLSKCNFLRYIYFFSIRYLWIFFKCFFLPTVGKLYLMRLILKFLSWKCTIKRLGMVCVSFLKNMQTPPTITTNKNLLFFSSIKVDFFH